MFYCSPMRGMANLILRMESRLAVQPLNKESSWVLFRLFVQGHDAVARLCLDSQKGFMLGRNHCSSRFTLA